MLLLAGPGREDKAERQAQADRQAEIADCRGAGNRQQAERQPGGQCRQQGAQQADGGAADLLAACLFIDRLEPALGDATRLSIDRNFN